MSSYNPYAFLPVRKLGMHVRLGGCWDGIDPGQMTKGLLYAICCHVSSKIWEQKAKFLELQFLSSQVAII